MSVYLVGAGPGNVELLTVRAARILASAQVVVYDRLLDPTVLDVIPVSARRIDVGKAPGAMVQQEWINDLLIELAREYSCVVRLKGGDPFVFGRGGEEALALGVAGVAFEVVPGVTSALSAPLAAGIPVTHRELSRGVTVVTGQVATGDDDYLSRIAHRDVTIVILMGVARRDIVARRLMAGGLEGSTSVAVVERAWTSTQRVVRGRLDGLASLDVHAPATIIVGPCAALDVCADAQVAALVGLA